MSNVVIMIGIVGFSFLILYLFYVIKDSQKLQIFRLLLFFVALGMMFLIPKVALDDRTTCENVLNSTTWEEVYNSTNNHTSHDETYTYTQLCTTDTSNTSVTFNRAVGYYYMIVVAYMMIHIFYMAYMNFLVMFGFRSGKKEDDEKD